jgi:hypothetical protein
LAVFEEQAVTTLELKGMTSRWILGRKGAKEDSFECRNETDGVFVGKMMKATLRWRGGTEGVCE